MKQNTTYFKVGLFVLLCAAGLVAGLIFFGADVIGRQVMYVETYIDESVQGLSVGSAVLHRGVNIGQVERISFVQAEYPMEPSSPEFERFGRYVMVVIAIDSRRFPGLDREPALIAAMLRNQVALGLRFKLSYQGITGITFIEADYVDPERHPELQVPWVPKHHYIPSSPSLFSSFTQAVENVFLRLEKIKFEEMSEQFISALADIQTMVHDADIGSVRVAMVAAMEDFKETNDYLQSLLAEIQTMVQDADIGSIRVAMVAAMEDFQETNDYLQSLLAETDAPAPGNIRTAIADFSGTLARIDELLSRHETDIDAVMTNLKILSYNLRQLSDSVKDNPARLFLAAPPKPSEIVQ